MEEKTFNPTMVWFYLNNGRNTNIYQAKTFNPTMVWFYLELKQLGSLVQSSQLSIPLWSDFIPLFLDELQIRVGFFQSHYGLILSSIKDFRTGEVGPLSIPLWSDFIGNVTSVGFFIGSFQSHYGLILSSSILHTWYNAVSTFNPTMVWFYHIVFSEL